MTATWFVATAMIAASLGVAIVTLAEAATTPYSTTGRLNVRTGPSTSKEILTTLNKGDIVLATGKISDSWLPIQFGGKTAYVFSQYVKKSTSTGIAVTGLAGKKVTNVNVNQRTKASLSSEILKVLPKGTTVSVTGRSSGDFSEIQEGNSLLWLFTEYLSDQVDTTPDTTANATTTTVLTLRKTASSTSASLGDVPKGGAVQLTGAHDDSYSQVVYNKQTGWILTGYFKLIAGSPDNLVASLPIATGKLFINATGVNMRSAADVESSKVTVLNYGTELATTGVQKNNYSSVIYDGKIRWVYTQYTQSKAIDPTQDLGSSSLNRLERYGKAAVLEVRENFPQIVTIGGWRSGSAYSSDHPNGRAIDIMIPSYKKNKALGDKIADWVIKNGNRLHVTYQIWYQRNYRMSRGSWTKMENRGSDTQNHKDHVHVSFYAS
jgi:uncharacterized protein YgiM (DUF1202 family)